MSRSRCTSIVRSPKHAWQLLLTDAADGAGGDTDSLGGKEPCSSQSVILRSGMLRGRQARRDSNGQPPTFRRSTGQRPTGGTLRNHLRRRVVGPPAPNAPPDCPCRTGRFRDADEVVTLRHPVACQAGVFGTSRPGKGSPFLWRSRYCWHWCPALPVGEQIDVTARTVAHSVGADRVPASQREPV